MLYKSIFISDVHLGAKDSKIDLLDNFLKNHQSEKLFLVGDIIDGWKIQQNKFRWTKKTSKIIRRILKQSYKTDVIYIIGNHDEFLRPLLKHKINLGNIKFYNKYEYIGVDSNRYLVIHGDLFDGINNIAPWLGILGDKAYDFILSANTGFNYIIHKFGFSYWSVSKYLKHKVKSAVDFIFKFESNLIAYCNKLNYDGVICGHIHKPEIKQIDNKWYFNDGDFVESVSALVETFSGEWIILEFKNSRWEPIQILDLNKNLITGSACIDWYINNGIEIKEH